MTLDSNNSGTDINVLTNFQPIPKRFMVWDDEATDWICVPGTERDIWDLVDLLTHKTGLMRHKFHMKIIQSTNLFDEDGEEIFEGSIIQGKKYTYEVVFTYGGFYAVHDSAKVGYIETPLDKLLYHEGGARLIGHIISNPELLEGK